MDADQKRSYAAYLTTLRELDVRESYSRNVRSMMACDDPDAKERADLAFEELHTRIRALSLEELKAALKK